MNRNLSYNLLATIDSKRMDWIAFVKQVAKLAYLVCHSVPLSILAIIRS